MPLEFEGYGDAEIRVDLGHELVRIEGLQVVLRDANRLVRGRSPGAVLVHAQQDVAPGGVGHGDDVGDHLQLILRDSLPDEVVAPLVIEGLLLASDG